MDEKVYDRLKREPPSKGISRFINATYRAHPRPSSAQLAAAYRAAAREAWRREEALAWAATEVESWPE